MNLLDRTISYFAPATALKRVQARAALSGYEAANNGRRRVGIVARGGSANTAIGQGLGPLRDRARNLVRNTPHGFAMVDVMVRHCVGAGIMPVWNTGSDRLDRQVTSLWEQFVKRADVEEELDFYAMQALEVRSMIEGGESLARFVDLQYAEDPKIPFRVQLLEGDHIDSSRDGLSIDGRRVRLGVALDNWSRRIGYHLFPSHPAEVIQTPVSTFVPRDQVRHLYRALRIGQVRGVSWLAPVLLPAGDLSDLLRNTVVKTGVEAAFSGFLTNTSGSGEVNIGQATLASGSTDQEWLPEPGQLVRLKPGQDIKFAEPKTTTQFEAIAINTLQAMAIGVGLTYDQITGDLRQANYSSLRAGKIEHRRLVEQIQWHTIIPKFCDPIADRFVDRAILAGSLRSRPDGYPREWVPPALEPIDPKKDLEADIAAVRAGRMSPQEFIGQWGRDWKKVVADTTAFWKATDAAGFTFDIDPRKPLAGAGGASAADPATENASGGQQGTADAAAGQQA